MVASKPNWPKTPAGATDWEVVFEAPESGLIALISGAQSATALRKTTLVIVEKLYVRDDDPSEIERFTAEISAMIPDNLPAQDLPLIADAVAGILRQIKTGRIECAAAYEAEKAAKAAGFPDDTIRRRRTFAFQEPPKHFFQRVSPWIWGPGIAAVAVGTIALIYFGGLGGDAKRLLPSQQLANEMAAVARGEPLGAHVFGGALESGRRRGRAFVTAKTVPATACVSAGWVLLSRGTVVINGKLPGRVSQTLLTELCKQKPEGAEIMWFPKTGKTKN